MNDFFSKHNDFIEKHNLLVILVMMFLLVVIIVFISNISNPKIEADYKKFEEIDKTPKLKIDTPVYIKEVPDLKYSQIKIKNISDEPLYDIFIRLCTQKTYKKTDFLSTAYTLSYLKAGETAILTTEHPNVSDNEKLKVDEIYYMDINGNYLRRTESYGDEDNTLKNMTLESYAENQFRPLGDRENILRLKDENYKKSLNEIKYTSKIINTSNNKLKNVYITFIKYNEKIVIGQEDIYIDEMEAYEEKSINIKLKLNDNLKLFRYGYTLDDFETKTENLYEVYPDTKNYRVDNIVMPEELERKASLKFYKQIIACFVLIIIDYIQKRLTKKSKTEGNEAYLKYIKHINLVKWAAIIGLIVNMFFS